MNGASNKVNHGTNGAKKRMPKYTEKGKGKGTQSRGKRAHGKGNKDLDFLDNDDGGHFGLLQHIAPSDLSQRKWVKVDLGNVVPDGLDASDFGDIMGIEALDTADYPTLPVRKRKGVDAGSNEEKANKKKAKKQKKQKKQKKEKQKEKKLQQTQQESNNNTLETIKTTNEVGRPTKGADAGEKVKLRSGRKESPQRTEQNGEQIEDVPTEASTLQDRDVSAWNAYPLHPKLMDGIRHLQFITPTEIQKRAIPVALTWKDIVAAAETVTFGQSLTHGDILCEKEKNPMEKETRQGPLAIVISPTRELATQIVDHLKAVAKFTTINEISVVPVIGGMSLPKQVRLLSYKPDVVVATPGRLWDLFSSGNQYVNHLDSAKWVVLDEADRLIQGNHFKEMDMLFEKLQMKKVEESVQRRKRQIFLFSATLIDQNIQIHTSSHSKEAPTSSIAKLFSMIRFQNPVETIDITKKELTATNLREAKILCEDSDKDCQLYYLLQRYRGKTIVFANSIHGVKRLTSLLRVLHVAAFPLYSDMEQRMRLKNLDRFKEGERTVLVATDVAARGLDIPNIDHVIHFQIPLNAETYVHRSGRTARAHKDGIAVMLISPEDQKYFIKIFSVLKKEAVVNFPVDPFFMPAIRKRVDLAHQIELAGHRSKKAATEKQWVIKNLQQAGGNTRDYYPSSDDEDDKAITARKLKKRAEANVTQMQQELNALLAKPLLPTGINRNYVTSTHFSTALLADPLSFHRSGAIQDLDEFIPVDRTKRRKKMIKPSQPLGNE